MDGTEIAVIAASWHLNDKITFAGLTPEFIREPAKAWRNYGSRVSFSLETALKDPEALDRVLNHARSDPYRPESQMFEPWFRGRPLTKYFLHLDLAKNKDGAGIALVHQEPRLDGAGRPVARDGRPVWCNVVDLVHREVAPFGKEIDFKWLREKFVFELVARGFNIALVTTDQWNCVAAGTRVSTARGLLPIEQVVAGDTVSSRSGPRAVTKTFSYGAAPTLRVRTSDGSEFTGTAAHRIEARRTAKDPWQWVRLDALRPGMMVHAAGAQLLHTGTWQPLPRVAHAVSGPKGRLHEWQPRPYLTAPLAEWLGVVWGDGRISEDSISVTAHVSERACCQRVFRRVFGFAPAFKHTPGQQSGVVEVHSRGVVRWMQEQGWAKPLIPDIIFRSPRSVKGAFLRGLFSADGHVDPNDGKASLFTVHRALAEQVQTLLRAEFGIPSKIMQRRRTVTLPQGGTFASVSYTVMVRGPREAFLSAVGFAYKTKRQRASLHRHRPGRDLPVRVRSIEASFSDIYDLEVEGDHSYLANGLVSHNSVEFQQQVRARGIETDLESADRTPAPYDTLLGSINDGSLDIHVHPVFMKEIRELRRINGVKYDHPKTGCFVGSTRVPLLDGTSPRLEDIVGAGDVWVYASDEEGRFVPAVGRARLTRYATSLVDVYLTNGLVERCTPDHLWRLRNGSYREARSLRPGDRLMPCSRGVDTYGYERVGNLHGERELTHRLVAAAMLGPCPDDSITHHRNHNKRDNRPGNLHYVTREEHCRHHTTHRHAGDRGWVAKLREGVRRWNRSDDGVRKHTAAVRRRDHSALVAVAKSRARQDVTLALIEQQRGAATANEAARAIGCDRKVVLRVLREEKDVTSWEEFLSSPPGANHRVLAVVPVEGATAVPVYDMEVDVYSNFALASGVYVHNSKDASDAVACALYRCIQHHIDSPPAGAAMISVHRNPTVARPYGD